MSLCDLATIKKIRKFFNDNFEQSEALRVWQAEL